MSISDNEKKLTENKKVLPEQVVKDKVAGPRLELAVNGILHTDAHLDFKASLRYVVAVFLFQKFYQDT
jgi:hypothetical protein